MVFCRGCAKQIHETAVVCPHCGAAQGISSNSNDSRNVVTLIFVGLGWTLVLWLVFLFMGGFIIGIVNTDDTANAQQLAEQFGTTMSIPILLLSGCLSGLLTKLGILPGSTKR